MQMHYNISSTSHFKGVFFCVILKEGENGLYLHKSNQQPLTKEVSKQGSQLIPPVCVFVAGILGL